MKEAALPALVGYKKCKIMQSLLLGVILKVHGFTQTEYSVMEGNTVDIVYKRNVKGETTFPLLTIQGSITSSSGGSGTTSGKSHTAQ